MLWIRVCVDYDTLVHVLVEALSHEVIRVVGIYDGFIMIKGCPAEKCG